MWFGGSGGIQILTKLRLRVGPPKKILHAREGKGGRGGGGAGFDERIEDCGSGNLNLSCFFNALRVLVEAQNLTALGAKWVR